MKYYEHSAYIICKSIPENSIINKSSSIIEFNKDFKRVVASHTALFKEEEAKIVKQAAKKAADSAAASAPTLGDANDALAALKKQMEKGGN